MPDDERLVEILGAWHEARDAGNLVDPEELIAEHADLADALHAHFEVLGVLDRVLQQRDAGPETMGPYRILREIGAGGMGKVYLAEARRPTAGLSRGDRVALKTLHPYLLSMPGSFKRFQREAELGRAVEHPNVVRTLDFDVGLLAGTPVCYLVMEYVHGQTLRTLLDETGGMPEPLLRTVAGHIASGLEAIHAHGAVHRDLKPENVIITEAHDVRIMDLGVARPSDAGVDLPRGGRFAGSLPYAAPEQLESRDVGPAADLYALGVLIYELASGSNPFCRDDDRATIAAHLEEEATPLDEIHPGTSPFLAEVTAGLLAKRQADRLPRAGDLATILQEGERSAWWAAQRRARSGRKTLLPRVPVSRESSLYGREAELRLLGEAWSRARSGRGNAVLLTGAAGLGKSRLVEAFLRDRAAEEAHLLYGAFLPGGGIGALGDALLDRFGGADIENQLRHCVDVSPGLLPAIAALILGEGPPADGSLPTGEAVRAVLRHLVRGLAAEKPLLWVVEDLHFADQDGRRAVRSLTSAVRGHAVLLLLTSRPGAWEEVAAAPELEDGLRRVALSRLSADDIALLLREAFGSERLVQKLYQRIATKSDGIPFHALEMIRGLKEKRFVVERPDGSYAEARPIDEFDVPATVRELVEARLTELACNQRPILDVGAVQGYEFDPAVVADVLGRPLVALLQDLAHVQRRSGLVWGTGRGYRFDHHLVREVVYRALAAEARAAHHRGLAEALAKRAGASHGRPEALEGGLCAQVCRHLLAGERGAEALAYLDPALRYLAGTCHRNAEAADLAERALAVPGLVSGSERVRLLLRLGDLLDLLGRRDRQLEACREATALARMVDEPELVACADRALGIARYAVVDLAGAERAFRRAQETAQRAGLPTAELEAVASLGLVLQDLGSVDEAQACSERLLTYARERGDRQREMRACGALAGAMCDRGRLDEARRYAERHLALGRELGQRVAEARAWGNLGRVAYARGRWGEAEACHGRHLAISREVGYLRGEAIALGNLALVLLMQNRLDEAWEHYEHRIDLSREIGDRHGVTESKGNLGLIRFWQGHLAEAQDLHKQHLALSRAIKDKVGEARALGNLSTVFAALGRFDEAEAAARGFLELAREAGYRRGEAIATGALGSVLLATGRLEEARNHFVRYGEIAQEIELRYYQARAALRLGDVTAALGRVEEARAQYEQVLEVGRELSDDTLRLAARSGMAQLPGGDAGPALALLCEHGDEVDVLERLHLRHVLWRATGDGTHLREAKSLLDHLVEHAPQENRESMLKNVRLHREIMEAWAQHGEKAGSEGADS